MRSQSLTGSARASFVNRGSARTPILPGQSFPMRYWRTERSVHSEEPHIENQQQSLSPMLLAICRTNSRARLARAHARLADGADPPRSHCLPRGVEGSPTPHSVILGSCPGEPGPLGSDEDGRRASMTHIPLGITGSPIYSTRRSAKPQMGVHGGKCPHRVSASPPHTRADVLQRGGCARVVGPIC